MKKLMIKYHAILLAICLAFLSSSYAYAEETKTQAQISFKPGEGPTVPVHPEYPDTDSNTDGETGSFLIVDVSDFHFGEVPLSAKFEWHDIETVQPNIQTVDLRGATSGWKVTASMSPFEDEDKNESLPGATVIIYKGRDNSLSVSPPPLQNEGVRITSDGEPFPVITAAPGAGIGLWVMRWYPPLETDPAYVQLEIPPGSATLGNHTAKINWVLENVPAA